MVKDWKVQARLTVPSDREEGLVTDLTEVIREAGYGVVALTALPMDVEEVLRRIEEVDRQVYQALGRTAAYSQTAGMLIQLEQAVERLAKAVRGEEEAG